MSQKWYKKSSVQAAIITGLFIIVAAIIAGLFDLHKINLQTKKKEENVNKNTKESEISKSKSDTPRFVIEQQNKYKYLSENQIRIEISNLLKSDDVDKAIELVNLLSSDEVKDEEYEHIFNYCIKNEKLEQAEILSNLYISPDKKKEAKKIIAYEKIKKK